MKYNFKIILFLSMFIFQYSCSSQHCQNTTPNKYDQLIFDDTTPIQNLYVTNEFTGEPNFHWTPTHLKHIICIVFSEKIIINYHNIANPTKAVWLWRSDFQKGKEGNIFFIQGTKNLFNSANPGSYKPPHKLAEGIYHWAVWAFNDNGTVISSSQEKIFIINI